MMAFKKKTFNPKRIEERLRNIEGELKTHSHCLKKVNVGLQVLLKHGEENKEAFKENVLSNVKELIFPYLEKLKKSRLHTDQMALVGILELNLSNIISPFTGKLSSKLLELTPMEIRVANLIKQRKTNKEIADVLGLSINTILFHRHHVRSKLGLKNKKINLQSYLQSFDK